MEEILKVEHIEKTRKKRLRELKKLIHEKTYEEADIDRDDQEIKKFQQDLKREFQEISDMQHIKYNLKYFM